jgi:hypothetical protein
LLPEFKDEMNKDIATKERILREAKTIFFALIKIFFCEIFITFIKNKK